MKEKEIKTPLVAIVTPVHNNKGDTREYLESLRRSSYPNFIVIIVDDGSTDGTEEMIREEFPHVVLIKGDGNLWANRSYNRGMERAREIGSDYILWIDNDTSVEPDCISRLVATGVKNPESLVTSRVRCYYEPDEIFEVGGDMNWLKGGYIQRGHREKDEGQYDESCDVKCATLGVLIPTSIIDEIGYIDAEYFPHFRGDVDFTYRAYKSGHRIIYEPNGIIWHKVSSTSKKGSIMKEVSFLRSPLKTIAYVLSSNSRGGSVSFREISRLYLRHFPLAMPYIMCVKLLKRLCRELAAGIGREKR